MKDMLDLRCIFFVVNKQINKQTTTFFFSHQCVFQGILSPS